MSLRDSEPNLVNIARYDNIDGQADASAYIKHMDFMREWPQMAAQKQFSIDALELCEGSAGLDVGCGTGEDVLAMASRIRTGGSAVGVDISNSMLEIARQRIGAAAPVPIELVAGTVYSLPFPDGRFDGVRAERVLEHVPDGTRAVRELVRVAKPGGRIVLISTDGDAQLFELPDRDLARRLLHSQCDRRQNGYAGRSLYRLLHEAGLVDVQSRCFAHAVTDPLSSARWLNSSVEHALAEGVITQEEATSVRAHAARIVDSGVALTVTVHFAAWGKKPA